MLHWITAFLTRRTQRFLFDGASSEFASSSVLYANNFLPLATSTSSIRLFADDSVVLQSLKTEDSLQRDIDALEHWESTWQMRFGPKCKILRFTRTHPPM